MAQATTVFAHDMPGEFTSLRDERVRHVTAIYAPISRGPAACREVRHSSRPCVVRDAYTAHMDGLLQIEDCLDADGGIVLPPGVTLISLIDRNIANVGDSVAYRYLDFTGSDAPEPAE